MARATATIVTDADMGTAMVAWLAAGFEITPARTRGLGLQTTGGSASGREHGGQLRRDLADDRHAREAEADADADQATDDAGDDRLPEHLADDPAATPAQAFSVPNSGTRWATAAIVPRLATANVAIRTRSLPRSPAPGTSSPCPPSRTRRIAKHLALPSPISSDADTLCGSGRHGPDVQRRPAGGGLEGCPDGGEHAVGFPLDLAGREMEHDDAARAHLGMPAHGAFPVLR